MSILNVFATHGAPVYVTQTSLLLGWNTLWVQASSLENVTITVSDGGEVVNSAGTPSGNQANYTASKDGWLDPPVNICLPSIDNTGATVIVGIKGQSGQVVQQLLDFQPLRQGLGKFLWYGVATGAAAGQRGYCSVFLQTDQTSDMGPVYVVAGRATSDSATLPDATPSGFKGRLSVNNGYVSARVQDLEVESVIIWFSIPASPDGDVLPVDLYFT